MAKNFIKSYQRISNLWPGLWYPQEWPLREIRCKDLKGQNLKAGVNCAKVCKIFTQSYREAPWNIWDRKIYIILPLMGLSFTGIDNYYSGKFHVFVLSCNCTWLPSYWTIRMTNRCAHNSHRTEISKRISLNVPMSGVECVVPLTMEKPSSELFLRLEVSVSNYDRTWSLTFTLFITLA